MAVTVLIPTPLRAYTGNQESLELEGSNISEVLDNLTSTYGDLKKHLYNAEGQLRNFVNVYLGDEDIRHLDKGQETPLSGGETISIVPSIAGG
ncbi:MAG: MoaD/ThiS family protein [Cyanobacteria bacterium J06639_1]